MAPSVRALARAAAAALLLVPAVASSPSSAATAASPAVPPLPDDPVAAALQAAFIWCSAGPPAGAQAYVAFRGSFALPAGTPTPAPPNSTLLHLFADARYMLWVDGTYVSRGPGRFNPSGPEYDTVDVGAALSAGGGGQQHVLTVLAHTYGAGAINGRIMYHAPGFTARLDAGGAPILLTNASWRCNATTEYTPSPVAWSSIPDAIDGRVADFTAWTAAAYDDAAWPTAAAVDGTTWGALSSRPLPMPIETPIPGISILPGNAPLAAALPLTLAAGASVVLNLTYMAMAVPRIELTAPAAGAVLTLTYALRYVDGAPAETYGVGTSYTARAGAQTVLAGDTWVSHYVVLSASGGGGFTVINLTMVDRSYPFRQLGSFASAADPLLTTLWQRGVNTLRAVTDDAYGSDARERNEWLQDPAQPNFITTTVAFAGPGGAASDTRLLRHLLRHAALGALPDGRIRATFPTDRGESDCHYFIEDYACQWVEALRWYYDASGDAAFVAWAWPVLAAQLAWFADRITSNGLVLAREYTSFDDPLAYITLEGTALNAFLFQAFADAAYLAGVVGNSSGSAGYAAAAAALQAALNDGPLWNATAGTYNSGLLNGAALGPTAHAAMIALHRGVVPAARVPSVAAYFAATYGNPGGFHVCSNPDFLAMIAAHAGVNMTVSHYWAFDVLYGLDTAAGDAEVLARMRGQWGNMVVNGGDAGTAWETFFRSESTHNYGAVPVWFLSSRVLGVRLPRGPASQRALVLEPHLAGLADAAGTVVTVLGPATVAWAVGAGNVLAFTLALPPGLAYATLRVPDADAGTLVLQGAPAPAALIGRYAVANLTLAAGGGATIVTGSITLLAGGAA
jgi:alpha-L-rhamnosidase